MVQLLLEQKSHSEFFRCGIACQLQNLYDRCKFMCINFWLAINFTPIRMSLLQEKCQIYTKINNPILLGFSAAKTNILAVDPALW